MTSPRRALVAIGSGKGEQSASVSLSRHLVGRLAARGVECETVHLHAVFRDEAAYARLLHDADFADLLIVSTPLYVDSLPYLVTRFLEGFAARRAAAGGGPRGGFACVVNCGFPEARQCETAIAIGREFAGEAGFAWLGGLMLGGGEALGGKPLERLGGMVRYVTRALDLAGDALARGEAIPSEAVGLMALPLVPPVLYRLLGSLGWKRMARRYGTQGRLDARPYE